MRAGQSSGKQAQDHAHNVVQSLRSKLASTSSSFKDVLEIRTSVPAFVCAHTTCHCHRRLTQGPARPHRGTARRTWPAKRAGASSTRPPSPTTPPPRRPVRAPRLGLGPPAHSLLTFAPLDRRAEGPAAGSALYRRAVPDRAATPATAAGRPDHVAFSFDLDEPVAGQQQQALQTGEVRKEARTWQKTCTSGQVPDACRSTPSELHTVCVHQLTAPGDSEHRIDHPPARVHLSAAGPAGR